MPGKISQRTRAEVSMLIVAFIWGSTFVMTKNALQDIGPFLFLGIRFMLAFSVLAFLLQNSMQKYSTPTRFCCNIEHGACICWFYGLYVG